MLREGLALVMDARVADHDPGAHQIAVAWRDRPARQPSRLVLITSYYLFFIAVIRYQSDQFFCAPAVLLAIFGGRALHWLWSGAAAWRERFVVARGRFTPSPTERLGRPDDDARSRYAAKTWLKDSTSSKRPPSARFAGRVSARSRISASSRSGLPDVLAIVSPSFSCWNSRAWVLRWRRRVLLDPLLDGTRPDYRPAASVQVDARFAVWPTTTRSATAARIR